MDSLPVNVFDIGVIALLLVGALIGLALGFVRGGLFVMSWVGAALCTLFGFPELRPIMRQFIDTVWIADLATGVGIFLVTLIVFFLISSMIGSWVRGSRLNALDRSLGLLAGLATAALILAGGHIVAESVWPPERQPNWVREARSMVLIQSGAQLLKDVVPDNLELFGTSAAQSANDKATKAMELKETYDRLVRPDASNSDAQDRPGYDNKERRALDRTIQELQQ